MTPDKATRLGNDLCCLAASIAEIGEELKAMYDFDSQDRYDEPEEQATATPKTKPEKPTITENDVRRALSEKSRKGLTAEVKALLTKYGVSKVSQIDPKQYAAILADAKEIK